MTLRALACSSSLLLVCALSCGQAESDTGAFDPSSPAARDALAQCLTDKGWVVYSAITCSACRAQRKAFGEASVHIREIECSPHAENSEVERCLAREIRKTPTWVLEREGSEIERIEGHQPLEDLATATGCAPTG